MLLAGRTASFNLGCHASVATKQGGSKNTKATNLAPSKLARSTLNKLTESSCNDSKVNTNSTIPIASAAAAAAVGTKTTNSATTQMKTISVRVTKRNGGYHNETRQQKTPQGNLANSIKTNNANVVVNENTGSCSTFNSKTAASTATSVVSSANSNKCSSSSTTKHANAKPTTSSATSSNIVNVKAATNSTTTASTAASSSSSSTTKIVPSASFLKLYTVPPTALHCFSEERLRSCSTDSLHDEMCHFKPIRSVPITPWKCGSKSRRAALKAPKPCFAKMIINCDVEMTSTRIGRENKRDGLVLKNKPKPKLSANLFAYAISHHSAFVPMSIYALSSYSRRGLTPTEPYEESDISTTPDKELRKNSRNLQQKKLTKKQQQIKTSQQPTQQQQKQQQQKQMQAKILEAKMEKINPTPKLSNTKKRKAEVKEIITKPKRQKMTTQRMPPSSPQPPPSLPTIGNRQTPPLTRGRIRKEANRQLLGPLKH